MDKTVEDFDGNILLWQIINVIGFLVIVYLLYLLIKFLRKRNKSNN